MQALPVQLLYTFVQVLKIIVATGLSLTGLLDLLMIGILFLALWRAPRDPKQASWLLFASGQAGQAALLQYACFIFQLDPEVSRLAGG